MAVLPGQRSLAGIAHAHPRGTLRLEPQIARRGPRHVDHAVVRVGPAIVDPQQQCAAVVEIGDVGVGGQRQGRVRRRQRPHVEYLAVGRAAAVEIFGIEGGHAAVVVGRLLARHEPLPVDLIGLAHLVGAAASGYRLAIGDDAGAGGDAAAPLHAGLGAAVRTRAARAKECGGG